MKPPPLLVITQGYSGTGKSSLAQGLSKARPFEVVSSDKVRKELAVPQARARFGLAATGGIYTQAFTRRTYQELMRRAEVALARGKSVILDATFLRRPLRQTAVRTARRTGASFLCIECRAADPIVRRRLEARVRSGTSVSDADVRVYRAQRKTAEPPTEISSRQRVRIDTSAPLSRCVARVLAEIAARRTAPDHG